MQKPIPGFFLCPHSSASTWRGWISNKRVKELKESVNMAKITIAGDAVVVTSAFGLEELRTIQKYRPKALILKGGEDGKEQIFAIGTTSVGSGNLNSVGASFAGESHDGEKKATITLSSTGVTGDLKEYVANELGGAIMSLNKLEATLGEVLEKIKTERDAVIDAIVVV
jgi:hypothetical protein